MYITSRTSALQTYFVQGFWQQAAGIESGGRSGGVLLEAFKTVSLPLVTPAIAESKTTSKAFFNYASVVLAALLPMAEL